MSRLAEKPLDSVVSASPFSLDSTPPLTARELDYLRGRRIFVDGVFKGDYSLAIVNRELVRALVRKGFDVTCHSPETDWSTDKRICETPEVFSRMIGAYPSRDIFDIHLRNTWPPETADMVGRLNAYVCFAWEEVDVPSYMVERFSRNLDLVMVTANFVRDALVHAGVSTPVEVVSNGCDHILMIPPAAQSPVPRRSLRRIIHVSSCLPRKGADLLLQAFAETFTQADDVELLIKTHPNPDNQIRAQLAALLAKHPDCPAIEIIETSLSAPELLAFYKTADLLVAPSRGEGFGLPFAEAMLCGVPVVTTAYSGQLDFCRPDTSYLVDYRLVRAKGHLSTVHSLWAEPDVTSLGVQIKAALADPAEAKRRTALAADLITTHFTWDRVAERVAKSLARLSVPRVESQPWTFDLISTWKQRCGIATYAEHLYATDSLGARLRTVLARDAVASERVPDRKHVTDTHAQERRVWNYDFSGIQALARDILGGRSDVLWIQHHPAFFSASDMETMGVAMAASHYKVKAITLHNIIELDRPGGLDWVRYFDIAFVHNAADAETLSRAGHPNPVVIPHGILTASTPPSRDRAGNRFTIGTFGFLTPHKNIELLLDAVAQVQPFLPDIRVQLLTCALPNQQSREARARVETLIESLGLVDVVCARFEFLEDDEIMRVLSDCDLLCFTYGPSDESASGAARIALAVDKPLLCSTSNSLADLRPISHILKTLDPAALAEVLLDLQANRAVLGLYDDERRHFTNSFSYEKMASRYVSYITDYVERPHD